MCPAGVACWVLVRVFQPNLLNQEAGMCLEAVHLEQPAVRQQAMRTTREIEEIRVEIANQLWATR